MANTAKSSPWPQYRLSEEFARGCGLMNLFFCFCSQRSAIVSRTLYPPGALRSRPRWPASCSIQLGQWILTNRGYVELALLWILCCSRLSIFCPRGGGAIHARLAAGKECRSWGRDALRHILRSSPGGNTTKAKKRKCVSATRAAARRPARRCRALHRALRQRYRILTLGAIRAMCRYTASLNEAAGCR